MDVYETIKNIRSSCENYADPDLVSTIIYDNYLIGKNNLLKIEGYGILENENYEDRFMKILKEENIFITFGMLNFIPMLNECDIYSFEDETFKITQEDFNENAQEKEVFFGILVEKDSSNYKIGLIDLCSCKVGSCFRPIKNSESEFYKKIDEIINKRIIS